MRMKTITAITLSLPWPPSVNEYWRAVTFRHVIRMLISKEGREFRRHVCALLWADGSPRFRDDVPLSVEVELYPKMRTADVDNRNKAILDALQYAGLFEDDNQVVHISARRHLREPGKAAKVIVTVKHDDNV